MNIFIFIGRLVRDPHYSNGVLKFSIAIDESPDKDGNVHTDYPSVTVFGKQAESGSKYLKKGRMVAVQGYVKTGSYTDGNGKTVYTEENVARRVKYLDYGADQSQQPQQAQPQPQQMEYVDDGLPF